MRSISPKFINRPVGSSVFATPCFKVVCATSAYDVSHKLTSWTKNEIRPLLALREIETQIPNISEITQYGSTSDSHNVWLQGCFLHLDPVKLSTTWIGSKPMRPAWILELGWHQSRTSWMSLMLDRSVVHVVGLTLGQSDTQELLGWRVAIRLTNAWWPGWAHGVSQIKVNKNSYFKCKCVLYIRRCPWFVIIYCIWGLLHWCCCNHTTDLMPVNACRNMGLLPDTWSCGLCMCRECRERFPRHHGLAITTCITARTSRTCRDACRDYKPAVSFEVGVGKTFSRHSRCMCNPQFYVYGKRPIGHNVTWIRKTKQNKTKNKTNMAWAYIF